MSQITEFKETQESKTEIKTSHPLLSDILINATEKQIQGKCEMILDGSGERGFCALGVAWLYAR